MKYAFRLIRTSRINCLHQQRTIMSQQSSRNSSSEDATIQKPKKTIADLPEEVILMIFKLLDTYSMDQAHIVFEKYIEIAESEVSWMFQFHCLRELNGLLRVSPNFNLESLLMDSGMSSLNHGEPAPTAFGLRKVKNLLLHSYNTETLNFFDKAQLEKLLFRGQPLPFVFGFIGFCFPTATFKFFAGQKNLTTLHLVETSHFFKTPIAVENVPFKLKELALSRIYCGHENVLAFMKLHEDSLETVQLGTRFSAPIYEFVFANLKKLKTLCLIVDDLKIGETHLEFNPCVTTLKLFERREHCTVLKAVEIIKHAPSVKKLVLPFHEPYEKLTATMNLLKQLEHLTVRTFDKTFWQDVEFSKLESLTFFDAELDYQSDIALVAKNKNLKSQAYDGIVENDFLNAISENLPNLVSLDLRKSKVNVVVTSHIRGLRLREEDFYEPSSIYGNVFCIKEFPYIR